MNDITLIIALFGILIIALGGLLLFLIARSTRYHPADSPYIKANVLTPAERDFFHVLQTVLQQQYYIFPQVRLANVVRLRNDAFVWKLFAPLTGKCVDYVICDKATMQTVLAIELDDKSHSKRERKVRDAFVDTTLKSAGIPILHVRFQWKYNVYELRQMLYQHLPKQ